MKTKRVQTPRLWRQLTYHAYSELAEFGVGIEVNDLAQHMQDHGYDRDEPIILFDGKILDGRHRHSAAIAAEVEPTFRELLGSEPMALEFVRKKLLRQHLDTGQRAMIAAKMATLKDGQHPPASSNDGAGTRAEAAKAMTVSEKSVDRAKVIQEHGSPALQRAVRVNEVSLSDAAAVAKESKATQDRALQAVRDGKAKTLVAALEKVKKPPKKKPVAKDPNALPADVASALDDVWHLECARLCSKLAQECKSAFTWSVWLDGSILDHLKGAENAFLAAAPKGVCPDCEGKKEVKGKACLTCRQGGYLAAQVWS